MSQYFDQAAEALMNFRKEGYSPVELTVWCEDFARDIALRCQMMGDYALPQSYVDRAYRILLDHRLVEWPLGYPGEPDPETEDDHWRLLQTGVERLHDLFHEIANQLEQSDSVLVYQAVAVGTMEDRCMALLEAQMKQTEEVTP